MSPARILVMALSIVSAAPSQETAAPPAASDPTSAYEPRDLHGWSILLNRRLLDAPAGLAAEVLAVLDHQLHQIVRAVPRESLDRLRRTRIWVELEDPHHFVKCMCYHPSAAWLRAHGFNPDKARDVEIGDACAFLSWTKEQPWMVLHELAHAYHDRDLGTLHAGLISAFAAAKAGGKYDSVLRSTGAHERHYALTSVKEYFAEGTEAFFGTNDFFPFVRAELREHDPALHALLETVWKLRP